MPFGLDIKSVALGALVGYFLIPRIVGPLMGAVAEARGAVESE